MRSRWLLALVLLTGMGLSACAGGANAGGSLAFIRGTETSTPTLSPTSTQRPTKTPTPSLTPTPAPSYTATSTPTPTATKRPTKTASPTPLTCWTKGGRIRTGSLQTDLLRLPLSYRVYLPPCYTHQLERRYPVLYLFHGQGYTDEQWDRLGVDETADALIATGELAPFIVVMPRERQGGEPGESNYGEAILEVLIPYVDDTYRTSPERSDRAVGGLSRGAGWAVHLAIAHWESFSALGAHSPAIFYYDAERMRSMLDAIPPDSYTRVYLDIGDRDQPEIMRVSLWFEELLDQRSIPHEWHLFSGYHNEAYWGAHIEGYLRWYARQW